MCDAHWSLLEREQSALEMAMGAIDKLDLRIPRGSKLTPEFAFVTGQGLGPAAWSTRLYERRVELSPLGWGLNLNLDHRKERHHKLELIGIGKMAFSQVVRRIKQVFDVEPSSLGIMRVDVNADTPEFSVRWFHENARVKQKRYSEAYGHFHYEHKIVESLYFGKRPSLFRIYDRLRHLQNEHAKLKRHWNKAEGMPTLEDFTGYPKQWTRVTRVERQYGRGIPASIATLGKLQSNAAELNPFEPLQFLPVVIAEESVNTLDGGQFLKGQGVMRLIEKHGYQEARKLLEQKTCRNTMRLLDQIRDGMEATFANTPPDLDTIYRRAVITQLTS